MAFIVGALAACALAGSASAQIQIQAGDILVTDFSAGSGALGRLFRVEPGILPETGVRTVVTEFSEFPSTRGDDPRWIAIERDGGILIVDPSAGTNKRGALFRVRFDPETGTFIPEVLSDFGDSGQGLVGGPPQGVAVEAAGQILVMVAGAGGSPPTPARLFRLDPDDGTRTLLSDFSLGDNTGSGSAIAVEADGQILILDSASNPRIYRVDPDNGMRTVVSELVLGENPMTAPRGIAVQANGQILVVDIAAGTNAWGLLVRVDPETGARVLVSDFGDSSQGPPGQPQGLAIEADGSILVTDQFGGTSGRGALFRVDPQSGARIRLSDFGNSGQGALGQDPFGVAVMPSLPGTLIVVKEVVNDNGGSGVPSDWTVTVTGTNPSPATFSGAPAPGTAVTLDPGTYSVDDTGPVGYGRTLSADCSGTIASGETKTCTITTDDQAATLLVIKEVVNNNGGSGVPSDWTITVTGTNPSPAAFAGAPAPGTAVTLDPDTYSVVATGPAGYSTTQSADCAGTIAAGETKTCTIASDDEPLAALPDLVVSFLQAPGSVLGGRAFTVQETTANTATAGAAGASITAFYLSLDLRVGPTDIPLGSRAVGTLAPGASASGTTSVTVPVGVTPGTYFIIAVADVSGVVGESGEGNNTRSRRIKIR
jgi:sugar lactone lactonase YvrE